MGLDVFMNHPVQNGLVWDSRITLLRVIALGYGMIKFGVVSMMFMGTIATSACIFSGSGRKRGVTPGPAPEKQPDSGPRSLLYPPQWTPLLSIEDNEGNSWSLEDYSYAGYYHSEKPLPQTDSWKSINVKSSQVTSSLQTDEKPEDLAPAIKRALLEAQSQEKPIAIRLPEGLFTLGDSVVIDQDQVVLLGQGPLKTRFVINPEKGSFVLGTDKGSRYTKDGWILVKPIERGDQFVRVKSPEGLAPGDEILVKWRVTRDFAEDFKSASWWAQRSDKEGGIGGYVENFRRVISRIEGDKIFFQGPMPLSLSLRDEMVIHKFTKIVHDAGIEGIGLSSAFSDFEAAWSAPVKRLQQLINISYCRDCWAKNISSFASTQAREHLAGHGLKIDQSFRVTLESIELGPTQHLGGGGNGYLFMLGQVNHVLVKDCKGVGGRHSLTLLGNFGSSQNVITNFWSGQGRVCDSLEQLKAQKCTEGYMDTHHPLAISNLFENSTLDDGIYLGNRQWKSNYVGQTATQNVMWNIKGSGKIHSFNVGKGYVIGTDPSITVFREIRGGAVSTPEKPVSLLEESMYGTDPDDFGEHVGVSEAVVPKSLFFDQLSRRLKKE
jgi:hypothetical protein